MKKLLTLVIALVLFGLNTSDAQQWFTDFKTYAQVNTKLDEWANDYSSFVTPLTIGQTHQNRDIRGVRISSPNGGTPNKPTVLLNGTQHAREWISPMVNMYVGETLLSTYDTDPTVKSLLDAVDVVILPIVNPDGYVYSWSSPSRRFWRKNRRNNGDGTFGVDLNRNWDFGWGLASGSSGRTDSDLYRGTAPFSEPETAAMRDFYLANPNIISNIDFHSYSQLILYPYGFSDAQSPADEALMAQVANQMAASIFDVHGEIYVPESASDLYLASGISIDWTYGSENVYSYTVELRPETFNPGFELPPGEILPNAQEVFPGVLDLLAVTKQLASGDFDYDDDYDCDDLDALYDAIQNGTKKGEFDVNGDLLINANDVGAWLASAGEAVLGPGKSFLPADANLDGSVDGIDFSLWNDHKFTATSSFCSGDFNADGFVDGVDFTTWNDHKFTSSDAVAVPEPAACVLLLVGAMCLRRRG